MAYTYNGAAINFPPEGEYISFSSVSSAGAIIPGTQTLVLGTSVNDLPSFPVENGATPQLGADDYLPIVNINLGTSFAYKITLGQISTFISDALGISGINGNLSLGGDLLLDENKHVKWDYTASGITYEYGITFHQTDGWKFKGLTSGFTTQALGLTKSGVLKLAGIALTPDIVAGGLYYDNTNLFFGY